jgi:hypothetical protein
MHISVEMRMTTAISHGATPVFFDPFTHDSSGLVQQTLGSVIEAAPAHDPAHANGP